MGHDDTPEAGAAGLTTVALPSRRMAREAVELLLRAVTDGRPPTDSLLLLRPELVHRSTTGAGPEVA
ncbi:substrate-binding domain-containing protein [Kitasatospora sp. MMS16-BH015]|uniref:substrate-binding domain-containing protein n=1 Tax=Kitasatospora sp. MMS16-BH015 TaxID=2018025 RepID=UPI0020C38C98|nr:substrate-binding domain-containing protein [Kitasatospora sp. MMS16-BH015]